jgi:tetratricopeptide (TPR) repeat protein
MKTLFTLILMLVSVSSYAQSLQALKDSLKQATDELAYHPDSIDLRIKKVSWNIQLEQWNYAKDDLDKVLFLDPQNVAGLYYRAFVNTKLGRYKFARLDYHNFLAIVPGNFNGQLGLALLNQKDKHYTEALDGINRLVSQYPDSAVAYAARGGIEKERGFLELALEDYTQAMKRDAKNHDYILNRIDLLILLKRKKEAKDELDRLVSMGVNRAELMELYKHVIKK